MIRGCVACMYVRTRYESFHTGFGPSGRATGFSVELLATLTRNVIADDREAASIASGNSDRGGEGRGLARL